MLELVACCIVFTSITLFPFGLGRFLDFDDGVETSLVVRSDNIKNPRYFSESFRRLLLDAIEVNGGINDRLFLSKEERILYIKDRRQIEEVMDKLLFVRIPLKIDKKAVFLKEVYAEEKIVFAASSVIRAVSGKKEVIIGENSVVKRWADADELLVLKNNCHAGKSITSGKRVVISSGCEFLRIYAPVIEISDCVEKTDDESIVCEDMPVYKKIVRNIKSVAESEELKNTIITSHNLQIGENAVVYGDIKSTGNIKICKNAIVTGNVFADGTIIIEDYAKVFENVFTESVIYIGAGVEIGRKGKIKSVISREGMYISVGSKVYGYIGTERGGKVMNKDGIF